MKIIQTDVAIIGAGTAGLSAYRAAKSEGVKALLIEGGLHGTTCARVGCMPSKLLIAASEVAHAASHAVPFGIHIESLHIDGREVMGRVKRERDRFVGAVITDVEAMPSEDRLHGHAHFVSDLVLQVGENVQVHASSIVIATGSVPLVPGVLSGLDDRLMVSSDLFDWDLLPDSIAVIGAGAIGLELGQALSRLGVQVGLFGARGHVGPLTDPALISSGRSIFSSELYFEPDGEVIAASRVDDGVCIRYKREDGCVIERIYSYALAAVGRRPNLAGLGLEHTSMILDSGGAPQIDSQTLRAIGPPVFFAGDVTGAFQIMHEAVGEGRSAGRNAALVAKKDVIANLARHVPLSIVFSDPQIALVGLRYRELPEGGFVVGEANFVNQGRSRVMLKNRGMLHIYAERGTARFLGAEIIGPSAEHLGHLLAWSLQMGLTVDTMLAMPLYHPVVEESLRTALRDAARKSVAPPPLLG
ncbi:dihydrolipoyl dehydrogenase [Stenotrophomonas sp. GD03993]|uniref:dihydrolipoyl dehydrogenase n=1 Tax=unclassified Stenotrophomonas TaxID=196198 RepID=UPI0013105367|nr:MULTISPECIES: dihydrolipoyl dehydrogenase [unclassified Stenotrophomonas]MBH1461362.1 dihydrolipoyl dehydrogenase [Stenotrophomonas maltophilia]MDH0190617.1 dihydrolipoyl dehydrogenase [Stenotrophomonas sp. GD04051]MDH0464932.1 dihydrolipoyl dehydrogenase [Stenotrophomonas sp. GD03993]MDH2155833.1 dihydrolipoyl dehydrogenase [Stenotrophomonas sp. GD03657]